jgi:hypothetical protein
LVVVGRGSSRWSRRRHLVAVVVVHAARRLLAIVVAADVLHHPAFLKPLLYHLVHQPIVPDKATLVLGLVVTCWTFEGLGSRRESLAQPLPVVTIGQVPEEHVATGKVAFAERAALAIALRRLELLEDGRVVAVWLACPLVQNSHDHVMVYAVMPDEKLEVLGLVLAERTLERRLTGQIAAQLFHEVLVGCVPNKVGRVEEGGVAYGARHGYLVLLADLVGLWGGRGRCCRGSWLGHRWHRRSFCGCRRFRRRRIML